LAREIFRRSSRAKSRGEAEKWNESEFSSDILVADDGNKKTDVSPRATITDWISRFYDDRLSFRDYRIENLFPSHFDDRTVGRFRRISWSMQLSDGSLREALGDQFVQIIRR
jgi:hypothetical protein